MRSHDQEYDCPITKKGNLFVQSMQVQLFISIYWISLLFVGFSTTFTLFTSFKHFLQWQICPSQAWSIGFRIS